MRRRRGLQPEARSVKITSSLGEFSTAAQTPELIVELHRCLVVEAVAVVVAAAVQRKRRDARCEPHPLMVI